MKNIFISNTIIIIIVLFLSSCEKSETELPHPIQQPKALTTFSGYVSNFCTGLPVSNLNIKGVGSQCVSYSSLLNFCMTSKLFYSMGVTDDSGHFEINFSQTVDFWRYEIESIQGYNTFGIKDSLDALLVIPLAKLKLILIPDSSFSTNQQLKWVTVAANNPVYSWANKEIYGKLELNEWNSDNVMQGFTHSIWVVYDRDSINYTKEISLSIPCGQSQNQLEIIY